MFSLSQTPNMLASPQLKFFHRTVEMLVGFGLEACIHKGLLALHQH